MGRGLKMALGGVAIVGFAVTILAKEPKKNSNLISTPTATASVTSPAASATAPGSTVSADATSATVSAADHDKATQFIARCEELRTTWYDATLAGDYGKADHAMHKLEKLMNKAVDELGNSDLKRDRALKEIVETRSVTNRYRLISVYLDQVKREFGLPAGVYAVHHEK